MADCTESLPEFLHPEEGMVQRQVNILTQSLNDAPTFGKAGTALETECLRQAGVYLLQAFGTIGLRRVDSGNALQGRFHVKAAENKHRKAQSF